MKIAYLFASIKKYLLNFFQLQLFITLVSFPILLCWGLPISLLSPVGNLMFSPILTVFLFISSLLFFSELLSIPNGLLVYLLQKISHFWVYIMNIDGSRWLFGFAKPSVIILLIIPSVSLFILQHRWFKNIYVSIAALLGLFVLSVFIIKLIYTKQNTLDSLACNRGTITIIHSQKGAIIIDPGVIGQKISAPSWVEYTLLPYLITSNGCTTIYAIIALQPTSLTFQALTTLIQKTQVKYVYIPWWKGTLQKHTWAKFFEMKRAMEEHGSYLKRLGNQTVSISIDDVNLTIQALQSLIPYQECEFCAYKVTGHVEQNDFETYSFKYGNNKPSLTT